MEFWRTIRPDRNEQKGTIVMRSIQVLVVGGGPSGMMAAITAAKQGAKVMLLEKKEILGKKILATGNGKCNFTNVYQDPSCYHLTEDSPAWKALEKFGYREAMRFFLDLGILPHERDGYLYPATGQASSVRNLLEHEVLRSGVSVKTETVVRSIEPHMSGTGEKDGFVVKTDGEDYLAKKVILAAGGNAGPAHGSEGDGYRFLARLGIMVKPPVPALTSCIVYEPFAGKWGGVRTLGEVAAYDEDGTFLGADKGELQFVANGLSGIPVFQISRFVARSLQDGHQPYLIVDLFPEWTGEQLFQEIVRRIRKERNEKPLFRNLLEGMLNSCLIDAMAQKEGISPDVYVDEIDRDTWRRITDNWKALRLEVEKVGDFDKAQVTCGGVSIDELNENFELKKIKGLYLTGEILDVDAICGGYNLQWAWTSGHIAGEDAGSRFAPMTDFK